jgi:SanA protein
MKLKISFSLISVGLLFILTSNYIVETSSTGRIYLDTDNTPQQKIGLVLGCAKNLINGRQNLFFRYRINATVDLYKAKKINYIIVSGDNSRKEYDEPSDMKNELIKRGVPSKKIFCDYAGFRTLDSIIRANKIFGATKLTVISQQFHVKRAICIGNAKGMKLIGYCAKEVNVFNSFKTKAREFLARTKMVLDLYVLNTQPKFLGPKVKIPT